MLRTNLDTYFPDDQNLTDKWVNDPFTFTFDNMPKNLKPEQEEEFINLLCDDTIKSYFRNNNLINFWFKTEAKYPNLYKSAIVMLLVFSTTYLCEKGFSSLLYIKNKIRNCLKVENDLRLYLNECKIDYKNVVAFTEINNKKS
jgi:hypothetical protein